MITRLNPTSNGLMHVGHAYLALINWRVARTTGGRFILRFDDNQRCWLNILGAPQMRHFAHLWIRDLLWLGLQPDEILYQSEMEHRSHPVLHALLPGLDPPSTYPQVPLTPWTDSPQYPYTPWLTAEIVWADWYSGVDHLIVGEDLLSRFSLYCWMADAMGISQIPHTYIPRLLCSDNGQVDTVSKTNGRWKIATLRERGMSPSQVLDMLARACLVDPNGEWDIANVKAHPVVEEI